MHIPTATAATLLLSITTPTFTHPVSKRQSQPITDIDILQYALTLEHLENVFYKDAVRSMSESDFLAAGFSSAYYTNLLYITADEEQHVRLLTDSIKEAGATPVAACAYNFPYTDPRSFVTLASVLEGVGTSAYLGGAGLIADKEYLGVAGSILVTESLHTSVQRFNLGRVAAADPYGTALGLNPVFTLAAAFIMECPRDNPVLPVKAFPSLTPTQGLPTAPGIPFTFRPDGKVPDTFFMTFVSGLDTTSVEGKMQGDLISAVVPDTAMGQVYVFVTKTNVSGAAVTDELVLFGPSVIEVTPPSPMFDLSQQ